jgi:hypothetical protein
MNPIVGIFASHASAHEACARLTAAGLAWEKIHVLGPARSETVLTDVPTSDAEQPGMGAAVGGVVGTAVGGAGGVTVGATVAAIGAMPFVGPIIVGGLVGATLFSLGGAAIGRAIEEALSTGVPKDELVLYQEALRRGRSLVVVLAEDDLERERVRGIMEQAGAESIDAAREEWWVGIRDEELDIAPEAGPNEAMYRRGFEAALALNGAPPEDVQPDLARREPEAHAHPDFRRGYERGRAYLARRTGRGEPHP